jgi:hypothetical protein
MFKYTGNNKQIQLAVTKANSSDVQRVMKLAIKETEYDMSTATSEYLAEEFIFFLQHNAGINIIVYYKWWSKALAYFKPSKPNNIYINGSKLNRSMGSIVGTFYHEAVHMFDAQDDKHSFGHGSNSNKGKQNTVPYKVGALVKAIVDDTKVDNINVENSKISVKDSWFNKLKRFIFGVFL